MAQPGFLVNPLEGEDADAHIFRFRIPEDGVSREANKRVKRMIYKDYDRFNLNVVDIIPRLFENSVSYIQIFVDEELPPIELRSRYLSNESTSRVQEELFSYYCSAVDAVDYVEHAVVNSRDALEAADQLVEYKIFCPNIKRLSIVCRIDLKNYRNFDFNMKDLNTLNIVDNDSCAVDIEALANLNVTELSLVNLCKINNNLLQKFIMNNPEISHLEIIACRNLSDAAISSATLQLSSSLTHLTVESRTVTNLSRSINACGNLVDFTYDAGVEFPNYVQDNERRNVRLNEMFTHTKQNSVKLFTLVWRNLSLLKEGILKTVLNSFPYLSHLSLVSHIQLSGSHDCHQIFSSPETAPYFEPLTFNNRLISYEISFPRSDCGCIDSVCNPYNLSRVKTRRNGEYAVEVSEFYNYNREWVKVSIRKFDRNLVDEISEIILFVEASLSTRHLQR